jgi:hypothetical protein
MPVHGLLTFDKYFCAPIYILHFFRLIISKKYLSNLFSTTALYACLKITTNNTRLFCWGNFLAASTVAMAVDSWACPLFCLDQGSLYLGLSLPRFVYPFVCSGFVVSSVCHVQCLSVLQGWSRCIDKYGGHSKHNHFIQRFGKMLTFTRQAVTLHTGSNYLSL